MFFDISDYNIPPCCSQKYFRFLFEHLRTHSNTTLFILPDFDLSRMLERLLIHVPISDLTLSIPSISDDIIRRLTSSLDTPRTDVTPDAYIQTHQLVNLKLIIPPLKETVDPQNHISYLNPSERNALLDAFKPYGDRVKIYEDNISSTIIHLKNKSTEVALYGSVLGSPSNNTKDTTLRLMHATTDPQVLTEIGIVLRMHTHHPAPYR